MSSRSSEIPKGRINVKFEVDTDGQKQEVSLPYKVLYLGDLGGDTPRPALKERDVVPIDVDTFDEVVKAHAPSLSFQVPDHVSGVADQKFAIDLEFQSLDDFSPDRLIEKVEALKALKARRDALAAIRYPLDTGRGELAERLSALLGDDAARRVLQAHYHRPALPAGKPEGDPQ
ncbi:type VI secretion system contractile sheath small subunit [Nannocystis sp. SCPEA4]|uniref:type VI secretion system contractile sheath small subunit n=1 Tax=Nannocystis sp. SCPEA4 TaxID=2996787 RepID=UPI002271FD9E|nr:type VI secretion system contractile sheath small subunit [Nannocystis sp. SCPEA4]MCY1060191.1 type VI secretion system contractile sheath small subunit [Nannocystis sp. SCPEA4]